jgi:cell division transport system permease protein
MFLILGRTLKESLKNFKRNISLNIASISILSLSLYVISVFFVIFLVSQNILKNIQDKVSVSIYFKSETPEEEIKKAQSDLKKYVEVADAVYISKDQALEEFKKSNAKDQAVLEALTIIGGNPLLPSLVVKAKDPNQYDLINSSIANAPFKEYVSRVNYEKNKEIIEKYNRNVRETERVGLIIAAILVAVSVINIFNTVWITIYTHRQEIEVMRLVGASNTYIRLPFIFSGIIYGILASILSTLILLMTVWRNSFFISSNVPVEDLRSFYYSSFGMIFGVQLSAGIILGIVSSLIATQKYLKK